MINRDTCRADTSIVAVIHSCRNGIGLKCEGCRDSNIRCRHGECGCGCRRVRRSYCSSATGFCNRPACKVITCSRRSHNSDRLTHSGLLGCTRSTSVCDLNRIVVAVARRAVGYIVIMQRERSRYSCICTQHVRITARKVRSIYRQRCDVITRCGFCRHSQVTSMRQT